MQKSCLALVSVLIAFSMTDATRAKTAKSRFRFAEPDMADAEVQAFPPGLASEPFPPQDSMDITQTEGLGPIDMKTVLAMMLAQQLTMTIAVVLVIVIFAYIYRQNKVDPQRGDIPKDGLLHTQELLDGQWRYGLCDCLFDWKLCCLVYCCGAVRWADTVRMAGFLTFWVALVMWLGVVVLQLIVPGAGILICLVGMYYRQKLRQKFENNPGTCQSWCEDCFTWWCCSCCAIIQEARQLEEAYIVGHPCVLSETTPVARALQ